MATIKPFRALRPRKDIAHRVATLPYDVCSAEQVRKYKDDPYNFYHVTRSEIDLSPNVDIHKPIVYETAAENLSKMIEDGTLIKDKEPCYYIYRLIFNGREQTGLTCVSSVDDYKKGIIKKHELTRPEKEQDRIDHIKATHAQTGVVFLTYKAVAALDHIIEDWKKNQEPVYDFKSDDQVQHTIWVIDNYGVVSNITDIFDNEVPATYIADGHHRAASAEKVAEAYKTQGLSVTGNESFNYFLTCIFPDNQVTIMDYNRVVKDLNDLDIPAFLEQLKEKFDVTIEGQKPYKPEQPHEFGMYLAKHWYKLKAKPGSFPEGDPIRSLDVSILQNNILSPMLGIEDPRTSERIEFVGGINGLDALQNKVNKADDEAVAFSCYPVALKELIEVADTDNIMPPKSTWFEPKTRDGLIIHMI